MYLVIGEWTTFFPQAGGGSESDGSDPVQDARERKILAGAALIQMNRFFLRTFFSPDYSVVV